MHYKQTWLLLMLLSLTPIFKTIAQNESTINIKGIETANGLISGIPGIDTSVMVFKGIPYAAPPIGELRWKAPQAMENWSDTRKCDSFGSNAMQAPPTPFMVWTEEFLIPKDGAISEDCLYLNVWTSAKKSDEKRPVMVYIHGGGFVNGSGSVPIYDGEAMAKKGLVFVTINYRMGVFGFLAHPELTKESPNQASGNYGILDQIAALDWVKKNIAAFGGDPANVTIAGQSAGAMSINILAVSPLAKGLFSKIIVESGAVIIKGLFNVDMPLDSAERMGVQFEKAIGVSNLQQLREVPAEKILATFKGRALPIIDTYVLPEAIPILFAKQKQTNVPLLTGYNGDDVAFSPSMLGSYKAYVKREFGKDSSQVLELYPNANDLLKDLHFGLQNFAWASMQSEQGKANTYFYYFNRKVPIFENAINYGAFHSAEVSYAYDNLKFLNRPLEQVDHDLAKRMSAYWANFAKTGNPNGEGLAIWPAFDQDKGQTMIFDTTSTAQKHPFLEGLKFLYERANE